MITNLREVRRSACCLKRWIIDVLLGYDRRIVRPGTDNAFDLSTFKARVSLEQPILATEYVQAKIHNIGLAMVHVNCLPLPPESIFSFWRVVGRPTAARGFLPGRSLLAGQLRPDYGGGLCQLSGLIYHASLIAGLDILERHPHSRDIYEDSTRYAPLGSDATVAYGFKDLRVRNSHPFPLCFQVSITQTTATCQVCSPEPIKPFEVEFSATVARDGRKIVETRRRRLDCSGYEIINISVYRPLDGHAAAPAVRYSTNQSSSQ